VSSTGPLQVAADSRPLLELVVCALDAWDEVWRRNRRLTDALLRRHLELRVLYVEPYVDPLYNLARGRLPVPPRTAVLRDDGRLHALRPLKLLPRRCGSLSDRMLVRQVLFAARRLGFTHPTLWLNDVTYAPLMSRVGWPTVYDLTDDWLLFPFPPREIARLRALDELALARADEVVVCSPNLESTRGRQRNVTLVPNAVDLEQFRRLQPRPLDMPAGPTAVYVGTLHDARLDVDLVIELACSHRELSVVLVGPDHLTTAARRKLGIEPNIRLLGPRPQTEVPGYLQHADVVLIPHLVNPFTESLDPMKAYECLAVGRPTVATPVAGFRELADSLTVAPRESLVDAVTAVLAGERSASGPSSVIPTWDERAEAFEAVLARAAGD
jgi:teichuronic acid biosynthesis glycosyltransferase TuaH